MRHRVTRSTTFVLSARGWLTLATAAAVALGISSVASPAAAETRRIAIVVGNNAGIGLRPPLRFAEADASKLEEVLLDLGGFARQDVHLLKGRSLAELERIFERVKSRSDGWRRQDGPGSQRVVLLFYFSGHSDGEALELGRDRLLFGDLRRMLARAGADVRLAIVDSCNSGALLAAKGGTLGPTFDIRFTDDLASSGEALLTSSAAHELALESGEVGASFFSHHLLSGLRGAADTSGDGRVTLAEAYRYAFTHTLVATADTLTGPQHPVYDYRLSGQGELVLTEVEKRSALLTLPADGGRILVQDVSHGQILAEVTGGSARRLALPPGKYRLLGRRGGAPLVGQVALRAGEERVVRSSELVAGATSRSVAKGGDAVMLTSESSVAEEAPADEEERGHRLFVGGGLGKGVAEGMGVAPTLRLGRRPAEAAGWRATLSLATGAAAGFRESAAGVGAGYGWGLVWRRRLRLGAGAELGAGTVLQQIAGQSNPSWTALLSAAAVLEAGVRLGGNSWLTVEGNFPAAVLRRDGGLVAVALPSVTAGLTVSLP